MSFTNAAETPEAQEECEHLPYISARGLPYCKRCGARLTQELYDELMPKSPPTAPSEEKGSKEV